MNNRIRAFVRACDKQYGRRKLFDIDRLKTFERFLYWDMRKRFYREQKVFVRWYKAQRWGEPLMVDYNGNMPVVEEETSDDKGRMGESR